MEETSLCLLSFDIAAEPFLLSGKGQLSQHGSGGDVEELLSAIINGPMDDSMVGDFARIRPTSDITLILC